MKNKKILTLALIIMLLIVMFSGVVNAKTYEIEGEGMSIVLDDEYIDVFTEYEENKDKLSEILPSEYYETFVEMNKNQGAVLDAIILDENNEMTTEVLVSVVGDKQYEVRDFKDYDDSKMEEYSKMFVEQLKEELKSQLSSLAGNSQVEIPEREIYKSANGDVYIKLFVNLAGQDSEFFYTVKNYKLIGVNVRYLDGNRNEEMAKKVVDSISIEETTSANSMVVPIIIVVAVVVIIGIAIFVVKRNKKEISE